MSQRTVAIEDAEHGRIVLTADAERCNVRCRRSRAS